MNIENEYIKFTHLRLGAEYCPEAKVEITLNIDSTLSEVLDKFEDFLRGSGYVFDGHLDIVNDDYE